MAGGVPVRHPGSGDDPGPFTAVPSPGHSRDSVCLIRDRICFAGDTVLGEGSVFVPGDGGGLVGYLAALERLLDDDAGGPVYMLNLLRFRPDGGRERYAEYARQTREALAALNTSVSNGMAELQSEIRELRRGLQDDNRAILDGVRRAGASSAAYAAYPAGYAAPSPRVKEEPDFPAAAEEFLNKNRRGAVVVKPDFQNGILVQDAEGNGELVLVRDYGAPDELLYVVPRVGYFQTKQDFYNYYDRYYECARPSAGTVWIVQPAVVDRANGGWLLREKGELEVR